MFYVIQLMWVIFNFLIMEEKVFKTKKNLLLSLIPLYPFLKKVKEEYGKLQ